jgi:hypothetical protein
MSSTSRTVLHGTEVSQQTVVLVINVNSSAGRAIPLL